MNGRAIGRSGAEWAQALRAAGLRVTGVRLAVLEALAGAPHADTDTVIGEVQDSVGAVSSQAVYNVLAALVRVGLARRIEPAGSVSLYELRVADNHHHIVCRRCGAVGDVDCAVGEAPCLSPAQTHGYLLDEAEVTYWGTCPACQSEGDGTGGATATLRIRASATPPHHRRSSPTVGMKEERIA